MPIISSIGRRSPRIRILIWSVYAILTFGAVTMVYPFLLMMSGSTKSAVDTPDAEVIPKYLVDRDALYRKHIEGLFNESLNAMQNSYGLADATFARLDPPASSSPLARDWLEFISKTGGSAEHASWFVLGCLQCPLSKNVVPCNLEKFREELLKEEGSIENVDLKYRTNFASASFLTVIPPNYLNRFVDAPETLFLQRLQRFCREQPSKWRAYINLSNSYRNFLQLKYGKNIATYNQEKGTNFGAWKEIPFGQSAEDCGSWAHRDFEEFARGILNPCFVHFCDATESRYREYIKRKYFGSIEQFNRQYETAYVSFDEVPSPPSLPRQGMARSDWKGFLEGWKDPDSGELLAAPLEEIRLGGPDFAFRNYLEAKYGSLDLLNARCGTTFASWHVVDMPQREAHYEDFLEMKTWLRWEFTTRNYSAVWNYLVLNGRGLVNTIIFCALAVLAALTVDPIAAYALSRFKPKSTYKILLFLMVTMAFPAMVTQIPTFLLLRDLGLLNSYWALVFPGIANGYHIFLLKGFFDSLPAELYESAEIDGANELTIFWNITMALSKPILAVIALGAFTSAYAAFMFALLLCQDPKMWTLMVWLYQLQQTSGQGIIFASLIVAAIPTFVIFVACQNVIMRGIVVPVEK